MNLLLRTALLTLAAGCLQPVFGQITPGTTTVSLAYLNVDPGNPYYTINPGGTVYTGTYNFSATGLEVFNSSSPLNVSLFCIDVAQGVSSSSNTFTVKLPSSVLGTQKAKDLALLYGEAFKSAGVANPSTYGTILGGWNGVMKQAFQLAVWELSQDTNRDLASGSFTVQQLVPEQGAYAQAQSWLSYVANAPSNALEMTLVAFQSDSLQDQIFPVLPGALIPEPSAVAAFLGLGMLGVAGARRRLRRVVA